MHSTRRSPRLETVEKLVIEALLGRGDELRGGGGAVARQG